MGTERGRQKEAELCPDDIPSRQDASYQHRQPSNAAAASLIAHLDVGK